MYLTKIKGHFKEKPELFFKYRKSILNRRSALNPKISFKNRVPKSQKKAALSNS